MADSIRGQEEHRKLRSRADLRFMTTAQVAQYFRYTKSTICRMLRSGELRGIKMGHGRAGWAVRVADVENFLKWREMETQREFKAGLYKKRLAAATKKYALKPGRGEGE